MATVNKASLRTEFDALKARFESLCAAGKMSAESRALVDALLMLFELLMAVFMEKHTPKSSANSSLPASQSPNDATARSRPGAKGKGPSYNDARYANTRTREHVRVLAVDSCARCGEDLTDTACTGQPRAALQARRLGDDPVDLPVGIDVRLRPTPLAGYQSLGGHFRARIDPLQPGGEDADRRQPDSPCGRACGTEPFLPAQEQPGRDPFRTLAVGEGDERANRFGLGRPVSAVAATFGGVLVQLVGKGGHRGSP